MEDRRRQRWDNPRRSQNKKPPRGSWKPTVPAWEKEFCKVVGSLDWETLLHMKKFMHLYNNVIEWNDSAGKEAFGNAKRRFWARKNGFSCDISLPDPDLYIDKIDWDSEIDHQLLPDPESEPVISDRDEEHRPIVIFGDSLMPNQAFTSTGWGDDDENLDIPAAHSSANFADPRGNSLSSWAAAAWPVYSNNALQGYHSNVWQGYSNDAWQGYPNDAWQDHSNDAWQCGSGRGPCYATWEEDWNNDLGWNYANNYFNYAGPDVRYTTSDGEQGLWNDNNVTMTNTHGYEPTYKTSRAQGNEERRSHMSCYAEGRHEPPYSGRQSAGGKRSASRECTRIAIGETWDQE